MRLSNDLAGLGGTVHYLRSSLNGNQYFSLTPQYVLSLNGRAGYIVGLGEDVNIGDRFFLGGDSLRGFKSAGAGPRDVSTGDALGGEWIYNGSVELKVPVGLPEELGIVDGRRRLVGESRQEFRVFREIRIAGELLADEEKSDQAIFDEHGKYKFDS